MNKRELAQKECLDLLTKDTKGILLLSPRFGKTAIGIQFIKREKFDKILWVTPNEKLRDEDIPNEFIKWRAKKYLKKLTVVCWSSLNKVKGDFDLVILDEVQFCTENNTVGFFNKNIKTNSILGLTGTMPKHKEKLQLIKKLGLSILKEITIDEAVGDEMIADYKIKVIEIPLNTKDKTIKAGRKDKPFYQTEFAKYQFLSKAVGRAMYSNNDKAIQWAILNRLRFIYKSESKLNTAKQLIKNLKGRKLIFCGSIEHAEKLSKYTYHSKTNKDDLHKFLNKEIDLLACVQAGGVGFTYKNVDHFIIIQADSNKSGGFIQRLARSLLKQDNYTASIYVLSLQGTQDEKWITNALESLDQNKIEYINVKNLKL
jgi:superfamily II DNA or RNA helicase